MSSRQGRKARGVSNVGNSDSTTTSSRGAHGRSDESENEIVAMEQEKGLVEYIDRGSVWLEYSDNRGDLNLVTPIVVNAFQCYAIINGPTRLGVR
jgi:hypothetical protein